MTILFNNRRFISYQYLLFYKSMLNLQKLILLWFMTWGEEVLVFINQSFKTFEIDRMSLEGIKLTDFHANGVVCTLTRAALMTGHY